MTARSAYAASYITAERIPDDRVMGQWRLRSRREPEGLHRAVHALRGFKKLPPSSTIQ